MNRLFLAVALAAACGNDGAGATFQGTVRGEAMTPVSSISAPASVSFASGTTPVAALVISDAGLLCTRVSANREPAGARALLLFLSEVNAVSGALSAPSGTGTFPVYLVGSSNPPPRFVVASFGVNDPACRQIPARSASAVSGAVTLTSNSGGAYAGTWDLTFESGDHVTGTFNTATCRGLADYLASNAHTCG